MTTCSDTGAGIDPKYLVTLTVYDLGGNQVAQVAKGDVALGEGSITWTPQFAAPGPEHPADTDAIYTYRLTAAHGACQDTWPSLATALTAPVDVSGVRFDAADLRLIGKVRGTLSRPPGQTDLIIYPAGLANPITISGDAGQPNPEGGIPIGAVPVPPNKLGDWIVVMLPVDSDEAGELNPGREPRPGMPGGGKLCALVASYGFEGIGTLWGNTRHMLDHAQDQQQHAPEGQGQYPTPAYQCTLGFEHRAEPVFRRLANWDAGGEDTLARDALVTFVGHGDPGVLYLDQGSSTPANPRHQIRAGTGDNDADRDLYYLDNLPQGSLSRCQCVLLVGCRTGEDLVLDGEVLQRNLLTDFRAKGAGCAIGSLRVIFPGEAQDFSDAFWESAMKEGKTATGALAEALDASGMSDLDWTIRGSTGPLRPAGYK